MGRWPRYRLIIFVFFVTGLAALAARADITLGDIPVTLHASPKVLSVPASSCLKRTLDALSDAGRASLAAKMRATGKNRIAVNFDGDSGTDSFLDWGSDGALQIVVGYDSIKNKCHAESSLSLSSAPVAVSAFKIKAAEGMKTSVTHYTNVTGDDREEFTLISGKGETCLTQLINTLNDALALRKMKEKLRAKEIKDIQVSFDGMGMNKSGIDLSKPGVMRIVAGSTEIPAECKMPSSADLLRFATKTDSVTTTGGAPAPVSGLAAQPR
jgi:hypothetical protein